MSGGSHQTVVVVRRARPADAEAWLGLRDGLWPDSGDDHAIEIEVYFADPPATTACLVAESPGHGVVGFVEVGLRPYAEECLSSPVGYVEGIYVLPECRGSGVGRALIEAAEAWARSMECTEMASDRALTDDGSGAFHEAVGYEETSRIVCYRKSLAEQAHGPRAEEGIAP